MGRSLAIVRPPPSEGAADALRALAVALVPHLRELLAVERRDDDLVEVAAIVPLPRRVVLRACRAGAIEGAHRVGRRWLATRAAVVAWVRSSGPRPVPAPLDQVDQVDDLDELRERLARPQRPRRKRTG